MNTQSSPIYYTQLSWSKKPSTGLTLGTAVTSAFSQGKPRENLLPENLGSRKLASTFVSFLYSNIWDCFLTWRLRRLLKMHAKSYFWRFIGCIPRRSKGVLNKCGFSLLILVKLPSICVRHPPRHFSESPITPSLTNYPLFGEGLRQPLQ